MIKKYKDTESRKVDDNMVIKDMFGGIDTPFNLVIGELDGFHGTMKNSKSKKIYVIIDGNGKVKINNEEYNVEKGDFVLIPENSSHSIEGNIIFAIICTPSFDKDSESVV